MSGKKRPLADKDEGTVCKRQRKRRGRRGRGNSTGKRQRDDVEIIDVDELSLAQETKRIRLAQDRELVADQDLAYQEALQADRRLAPLREEMSTEIKNWRDGWKKPEQVALAYEALFRAEKPSEKPFARLCYLHKVLSKA